MAEGGVRQIRTQMDQVRAKAEREAAGLGAGGWLRYGLTHSEKMIHCGTIVGAAALGYLLGHRKPHGGAAGQTISPAPVAASAAASASSVPAMTGRVLQLVANTLWMAGAAYLADGLGRLLTRPLDPPFPRSGREFSSEAHAMSAPAPTEGRPFRTNDDTAGVQLSLHGRR